MLDRREIDWRKNPVGTADNIDYNFKVLFNAFNDLVNEKLESVDLTKLRSDVILSGSTDLSHLFAPQHDHWITAGRNVTTSGTPYNTTIDISATPSFDRIYSGGSDLSSIFRARKHI